MPDLHLIYFGSGAPGYGTKCSYSDKGGSKVLLTLSSNSYDPHTILRPSPLPLDLTTQHKVLILLHLVSLHQQPVMQTCTYFWTEGEAHKWRYLLKAAVSEKGQSP